jgi:hypothetical protein
MRGSQVSLADGRVQLLLYICAAQNVRVVQRNLVYVVGLALELCYEDLLKGPDYFGQFGKVVKVRAWQSLCTGQPVGMVLRCESHKPSAALSRPGFGHHCKRWLAWI